MKRTLWRGFCLLLTASALHAIYAQQGGACFQLVKDSLICDAQSGDVVYTFTLTNRLNATAHSASITSLTPGTVAQPGNVSFNPPLAPQRRATVTVRVSGTQSGQRVRLQLVLRDATGNPLCNGETEIIAPPCCLDVSNARVECSNEGGVAQISFDLTNRLPDEVCAVALTPQQANLVVTPDRVVFNPPLRNGETRRIAVSVRSIAGNLCPGDLLCLQLTLQDCAARALCGKSVCLEAGQTVISKLWTTTRDFEEGTRDNIDITNDEIKLPREQTFEYPWVWVTNNMFGTVSKIDARTHQEVARYYGPPNMTYQYGLGLVSRTTVDRFGNVWVECRGNDSVIQILDERNWTLNFDYNGNGILDTSRDLNNDGCIQPNEMLPFGQDELVARYYRFDQGSFPRALAIDLNGYLWVGFSSQQRIVQVDPNLPPALYGPHVGGGTPPLLEDITDSRISPYGFATARNGYIYFTYPLSELCPGDPNVPNDAEITKVTSEYPYGLAVDRFCRVWGSSGARVVRWIPSQNQIDYSAPVSNFGFARGVNIDLDDIVWISETYGGSLAAFDSNTLQHLGTFGDTCTTNHSGIGIAFGNQIVNPGAPFFDPNRARAQVHFWTYDQNTNTITRTGCTDCPGLDPYNYNDFTGALLRFATQEGIWSARYDSGCAGRTWGRLNWNALIPNGTSLIVRVRTGDTLPITTEFITVGNGQEFCLRGRYLEVEVRLSRTPRQVTGCSYNQCADDNQGGEFVTPILYDLRATSLCDCGGQPLQDVRGKVLADSIADGVPTEGDRPLQGWAVTIEDVNGNRLTRYTNREGEYLFQNIPSGEYRLVQVTPPGWLSINPVGGQTEIEVNGSSVRVDFVNRLVGDVDGTLCVDDADLLAVLMAFGASGEGLSADVNMDGVVDDADLLQVLMHFGLGC